MLIRDARPDEALALASLQQRSSFVWEEDRAVLAAHPDAFEPPHQAIAEGRVRVAVDAAGRLLGFSTVLPIDRDGSCELDDLFVEPAEMRRGVGRALVDDVVLRAADAGARRLEVTANANALGFYTRVGFEVTGQAATEFGSAAPRLALDLHRRGGAH